jgi:uncharacterized protein
MSTLTTTEHVERVYAAFEDDELETVLALSAPDVEFHYPAAEGLAYGGVWRGRDGVRRFFEAHDETDEVLELRPAEMVAQGEKVVVLGTFRGRAVPTGREWTTDFVHVFTIRDGTTRRFASHFDTAAQLGAHGRLAGAVAVP